MVKGYSRPTGPVAASRRRRPLTSALLRVGEDAVLYDVVEEQVIVAAVLHKQETVGFYREDQP
jgi:hypothetical protein